MQTVDTVMEGEDGDREGFSLQTFRFIKQNNDLSVIVNIANASLYSLRNNCNVFNVDSRRLTDGKKPVAVAQTNQQYSLAVDDDEYAPEPPFVSMTVERD